MQLVKSPVIEAEEIERRKTLAKEHFDAIKKAGALESTSSMRIGWHAYRLKLENLFGVLGFADETEAREAAGVGNSTWYSTIRLAETFEKLSEESFVAMRLTNAQALSDMPESKRYEAQWVRDASHKSIKEFRQMVDEALNGKARPSDSKERSTSMKLDMPASRKAVIEQKTKQFAETHGIEPEDTGKIFELMCVETTDGDTLISAITNAIQQVREVKKVANSGFSAEEALVKINDVLDQMVLDFSAALRVSGKEKAA